jgi:antagonist of KipI
MAMLRIIRPGLLTTIQDRGRWGYQSKGVPVAGPMDLRSHRIANALVGNVSDEATLETTLVGPEIEFEDERLVAVAGAEFALHLDDRPVPIGEAFVARAGAHLRFGHRARGARAYVGVSGGIEVPFVLGSRSTHVVTRMGGFEGRALAAGDRVALGMPGRRSPIAGAAAPASDVEQAAVRVLPGPHLDAFPADALNALQAGHYVVSGESDRMAFRLEGPVIAHAKGADILSEATLIGELQVPASGEPILLMADRQTSGGYPAIATVIAADLPRVGQLAPGDAIAFSVCSRAEAIAALIAEERRVMALEQEAARG